MTLPGVTNANKRERLRLNYLAAAIITTSKGEVVRGNLRDIGIESLYIKIEKKGRGTIALKDSVDVDIIVTQGVSRLTIATPGKIIRVDDEGVAILFTEPLKWWPIFSLFPVNEHFLFDIVTKA